MMIYPCQSSDQEPLQHEIRITEKPGVFTYIDY